MAWEVYYGVHTFLEKKGFDGICWGDFFEAFSEKDAIKKAEQAINKQVFVVGCIAFKREGNVDLDEWEDPVIIAAKGIVPDDIRTLY